MMFRGQAATSFECDGCNHHASFHSLENPAEDAILQKWASQEKPLGTTSAQAKESGGKRRRIANEAFQID